MNLPCRKVRSRAQVSSSHLPAALLLSLNENLAEHRVVSVAGWPLVAAGRRSRERPHRAVPRSGRSHRALGPAGSAGHRACRGRRAHRGRPCQRNARARSLAHRRELTGKLETTLSQRDGKWGIAGNTPLRLQAHATVGSLKPVIRAVREERHGDGRVTLDVERDGPLSEAKLQRTRGRGRTAPGLRRRRLVPARWQTAGDLLGRRAEPRRADACWAARPLTAKGKAR